jgi:hypothetical protein
VLEPQEVEKVIKDVVPRHLILGLPDHLELLDGYRHDVPKISEEGLE